MALITKLKHQPLQAHSPHSEAECTYEVVTDDSGHKFLQLDTYGSKTRKIPGKKSQSLRLSSTAIADLKTIIREHGL